MSSDIASEITARQQIWLSFDSLLRSYAAAAAVNGEEPLQVQTMGNCILVAAPDQNLGFHLSPADGSGQWLHTSAAGSQMGGRLDLSLDGAMCVDGQTKDLDHAAIDFVAMLRGGAAVLTGREP